MFTLTKVGEAVSVRLVSGSKPLKKTEVVVLVHRWLVKDGGGVTFWGLNCDLLD